MAYRQKWTAEQLRIFQEMWAEGAPYTEISKATGRPVGSCKTKRHELNMPPRPMGRRKQA